MQRFCLHCGKKSQDEKDFNMLCPDCWHKIGEPRTLDALRDALAKYGAYCHECTRIVKTTESHECMKDG